MNRKTSLRFAGYVFWFLFLTFLFALVNFPRENLTSWVNQQLSNATNGALRIEEASPILPLSLKLRGLSHHWEQGGVPLGDAVVSPSLLRLLMGSKDIRVHLSGPWESSRFRVRSEKKGWGIEVKSFEADLGGIPFPYTLPYRFQGTARAAGSLRGGSGSSETRLDGQGEISGEGIEIAGGLLESAGLSPLNFSRMSLFFSVEDGVVSLGENQLQGDLTAVARGTVRLAPDRFENSRLDLVVEVKPGERIKEKVLPLFSLAGARPRVDGTVTFRIRGTVGRPSITG